MTKKAIGFMVVFIAFVMAVPLSAQGPAGGKNGQSPGTLTDAEIHHITYMREEEKLARDVYLTLYDVWEATIFDNISASEQSHMDALLRLIDKYDELEDPVKDLDVGEFPDPDPDPDTDTVTNFNDLYTELVEKGVVSYCEALQVGIKIEDLDIHDIEVVALQEVEAKDVIRVFNNLLDGSYNHLDAFTSQYELAGCE